MGIQSGAIEHPAKDVPEILTPHPKTIAVGYSALDNVVVVIFAVVQARTTAPPAPAGFAAELEGIAQSSVHRTDGGEDVAQV